MASPPANVDVERLVTERFVIVVVPSCERPETERAVEVVFVTVRFVPKIEVPVKVEAKKLVDVPLVKKF